MVAGASSLDPNADTRDTSWEFLDRIALESHFTLRERDESENGRPVSDRFDDFS